MSRVESIVFRDDKIELNLRIAVFKEDEFWIALSPSLDLSGYGDTQEEAFDSFEVSLGIMLEETQKRSTLDRLLKKLGWSKEEESHVIREVRTNLATTSLVRHQEVSLTV